ncbi:hypothetical protein B0I31_10956 [Saccharothrix carnea]|uniref:Uncharacterized protein n=1 Tax=Saccharothrix carnea TaxID=1280637 RepID=A0A2P8I472_SACCR|nr:hypothetical protein [Saccharothrix carnea]PSL53266.1 hypothetical protein B0I31_10956 [Saccharothrix carnea]
MPKTVLDAVLRYYGAEASNDPERGAVAKKRRRPPQRIPFKPRNLPPLNDTMPLDEDRP